MDDFGVHDVQVQDISALDRTGGTVVNKQVTFFVGKHGPFVRLYRPGDYSPDKVTKDIQGEVDALKTIHSATSGSSGY
jgi:hypothetical protein